MRRSFRLTRSTDVQRVRQSGKSLAHPLIVLVALPNQLDKTRFAVIAGRAVGNAVQRNRAKRLLRAAVQPYLKDVTNGWDVLLIARRPISGSSFQQVQAALVQLFSRAKLIQALHDSYPTL